MPKLLRSGETVGGDATIELDEPDTVRSFWHGSLLNPYLLLCLRSFVRQGCRVEVFSYEPDPGFPEWIVARDAREIVPAKSVLVYRKGPGAGSPSLHSNLFRFALLDRLGGWWIDTDIAMLRGPLPSAPYYFAVEEDHFANSVVKFPKGYPLLEEGAERCRQADEDVTWGVTGPILFTSLVHHHKLADWAVPAEQGCPFIWSDVPALFDPVQTDEMMARSHKSRFVHLYCEMWRRMGIPVDLGPPVGSFLDHQFRQSDLDLRFAARIDMRHLAIWAANERARAELETSRAELETSRAELGTSRAELGTSRAELETSRAELRQVVRLCAFGGEKKGISAARARALYARITGTGIAARRAQSNLETLARQRRRFVICIPFLKFGGAEKVAANLAHALAHLYGPDSVAVLVTDWSRLAVRIAFPEDASIREWFPAGVPVVDIAGMRQLQPYPRRLSLMIALMSMKPELAITINSATMWEMFQLHGADLAKHMRLASVAFVHARDRDGKPIGFTATHLKPALKYLNLVITDNHEVVNELSQELQLSSDDQAKFKCLYQYQNMPVVLRARRGPENARPQVLWASRVTRSKCPELLPAIAGLMPDCDFHAYGARELGYRFPAIKSLLFPNYDLGNRLLPAMNLYWHGPFKRFDSLPIERYDALLYTGLYDGLPNVLIEAGAHRIPIVAPNVGGISELITDQTGWFVRNPLDAIEYASAIRNCLTSDTTPRTEALASIITSRHSFETFCQSLKDIIEAPTSAKRIPTGALPRAAPAKPANSRSPFGVVLANTAEAH
jgi:glycosyltransferase involved in cell wall biosynthesis